MELAEGVQRARADRPGGHLERPRPGAATTRAGKTVDNYKRGALGDGEPLPGRPLHAGRGAAARPEGRRAACTCRSAATSGVRAACVAEELPTSSAAASCDQRPAAGGGVRGAARLGARADRARPRRACAAASCAARPDTCAWHGGCSYPSICRVERQVKFTDEQLAAIERRDGSLLVRAGAGTGKTSVLVERFVRAVRGRRVPVESILAITFTEKAAAELRTRVRAPLRRARAARGGARGRGGVDLDDPRLLRAGAAHPRAGGRASTPSSGCWTRSRPSGWRSTRSTRALGDFLGEGEDPERARDGRRLHPRPPARHGAHRLRAPAQPRAAAPALPAVEPPRAAGERELLETAAPAALAELGGPRGRAAVATAIERLRALPRRCSSGCAAERSGRPAGLTGLNAQGRRQGRSGTAACEEYREALAAYSQLCAAHRASTWTATCCAS